MAFLDLLAAADAFFLVEFLAASMVLFDLGSGLGSSVYTRGVSSAGAGIVSFYLFWMKNWFKPLVVRFSW